MSRLVILGRDGVINRLPEQGLRRVDDWQALPGSPEAIARLNHAGLRVVVITEQQGLADGNLELDTVNLIHARMHQVLSRVGAHVDAIFTCPREPEANCDCAASSPQLYREIAERFSLGISGVPVVSDNTDHLLAAREAGALALRVGGCGKADEPADFPCFDDLGHLVEHLLTIRP